MSNVIDIKREILRNENDLKNLVRSHAGADPQDIVRAINISLQLAVNANNAAHHHRLDAARMLLELRCDCEARGINWWKWQKGQFNRSRKDIERLLRMASAPDPVAAIERERAERNARRAKSNGAARRSNQSVEHILQLIDALTDQQRRELRAAEQTAQRRAGHPVLPKNILDLKRKLRDVTQERDRWKDYAHKLTSELTSEKILSTGILEQNKKLTGLDRAAKFTEIWNAADEAERDEIRAIVNVPPVMLQIEGCN
jgi:hypothetical protein